MVGGRRVGGAEGWEGAERVEVGEGEGEVGGWWGRRVGARRAGRNRLWPIRLWPKLKF